MSFISLEFIVLFSVVVPLYYLLPHKTRWLLLLAASYIFYMAWQPKYVLLILLTTVCDYFLALRIHSATRGRALYLSLSIFLNLSILFFF